ncbi:MRG-domain-containing protein [Protomyces lactucae-debilis]|uniref:Chromatin modification-related protein EAF3 n=1 Tax=Protomyces lactucae-debilis TaxID=2754530 RepID=A0A1Y2F7U2_PROLT|nr:MRG-domain-containing protein [Protomyces lactucae-debilis]ORY79929.1 MRG-domain-containing protein [Protomyces lactucae-debilis]
MAIFKAEERVLCYHGPLLYEAKHMYLVHYKGWKRTWDEWVPETRVKKWNEANLKFSKELKMEAIVAQKRLADEQKRSSGNTGKEDSAAHMDGPPASTSRGQKRGREAEQEKENALKPNLRLEIPDLLKAQLVDDWEWITKDSRLVPLPPTQPRKDPRTAEAAIFHEVIEGLRAYFDKCLGNMLLYKFERQQYLEVRKKYGDAHPMSQVFGAEHLLRLFVSMQDLVAATEMDPQAVAVLRRHLTGLLKYMLKHHKELFLREYDVTSPYYTRLLNHQ